MTLLDQAKQETKLPVTILWWQASKQANQQKSADKVIDEYLAWCIHPDDEHLPAYVRDFCVDAIR